MEINQALNYMGRFFNDLDFTQYDLDAPFPELGDYGRNGWESSTDSIKKTAREKELTLREMALRVTPNPPMGGVKAGQIGMREPTREKAWAPLGPM